MDKEQKLDHKSEPRSDIWFKEKECNEMKKAFTRTQVLPCTR